MRFYKQLPRAAVRKGAATAFRAGFLRTAGYHGRKEKRAAGGLFGGADFQKEIVPTVLENWGKPKTLGALSLRRGRVRDAREEKAVAGT